MKRNDEGADTVAAIMIILAVFIITAGLLIGMYETDTAFEQDIPGANTLIEGITYTKYTPTAGRAVTWANDTSSYHPFPQSVSMHFWKPDDTNPFHVTVVRNNTDNQDLFEDDEWFKYDDYIGIEKAYGWWSTGRKAVSLSSISDAHNLSLSSDTVVLPLTGGDAFDMIYYVIIETPTASGFLASLYTNNTFTIYIAELTYDTSEITQTSWWDTFWNILEAISTLFTFNALPEVPIISYLISGGVWMALIYLVFTLITRGLHGGG